MVDEGILTPKEAVGRIEPGHVDQLLRATFDPKALAKATKIVNGLNASPGRSASRVSPVRPTSSWTTPTPRRTAT
jgi:pyruvate,orthophosphate dikinase